MDAVKPSRSGYPLSLPPGDLIPRQLQSLWATPTTIATPVPLENEIKLYKVE